MVGDEGGGGEDQAGWNRRVGALWPSPSLGMPVMPPGRGGTTLEPVCAVAGHSDSEVAVVIGTAVWVGSLGSASDGAEDPASKLRR